MTIRGGTTIIASCLLTKAERCYQRDQADAHDHRCHFGAIDARGTETETGLRMLLMRGDVSSAHRRLAYLLES